MTAIVTDARPGAAVTGLAVRQAYRGAVVVAALSAGMSALVAATYRNTVGGSLDVSSLAALAANPAIRTLFGQPAALDTPGGFTVWRTGTVLAVLVGVWGATAATRLTRGEEDAGRWDLLLAGRLPIAAVVARQLAVLAAAMLLTGVGVTAALLATGTAAAGAALHGAGVAALGLFFAGAGALAAQVWPARPPATAAAMALLGAALLARMVGDGVDALSWLRWLTPFGLLELSRPYAGNQLAPLLVLVAGAVAVAAAAPAAARRDLRGGRLRPAAGRGPRLLLLGSVPAFAVRRLLQPLLGWSLGIGAYCLLIGLIAPSMTGFLTGNPRFADAAAQAGFTGLGTAEGYAGTFFALLTVPIGLFTAVRLAAFTADEAARRLTMLYAQPVTRRRLAWAEAAAAGGGAVLLAAVAGGALWAGSTISGAGFPFAGAVAGALNALPIVLLSLAAAVFALGVASRAVTVVGSLPGAGGFLWKVIADSIHAPGWLATLTPYAHLALVPAQPPDWAGAAAMLAIAAALSAAGLWAYQRRDLRVN